MAARGRRNGHRGLCPDNFQKTKIFMLFVKSSFYIKKTPVRHLSLDYSYTISMTDLPLVFKFKFSTTVAGIKFSALCASV